MKHYFKDYGLKLFENGYKPIPIRPKKKIPFFSEGESWQVDITEDVVKQWSNNGKGNGGVALTGLCGIDFDIHDKEVSNKLIKYVRENISKDVLIRIGQKPKFLIPASPDSAVQRKKKITWYDQEGQKHEIEFLAPGTQYFLVYGIHPNTGDEFKWVGGRDVLKTKVADLPVIDELDISGLEDEFDSIAGVLGWTQDKPTKKTATKIDNTDPLENLKTPGEMSDSAGLSELGEWLNFLPGEYREDYDLWIMVGAAVHHETGGSDDGWLVWDKWSKESDKYKGRVETIKKWESFTADQGLKDGSQCSSRGSLIHALQEAGTWKQAKKAGDAAREDALSCAAEEQTVKAVEDIVCDLNEKYAVVNLGGRCRIMQESHNYEGELDLDFFSVQDFKTMHLNHTAPNPKDPKKSKPVSNIWLESKERREYKGIIFEPGMKEVVGYYNLWKGFKIKPVKGDWGLYKDHIYTVIADGNEKICDWIIAWMARIVQDPGGRRPGTSIVLQGEQGTGKGVFVNTFGDLFGEHFLPVSHASQVAGRFNSHLKNKLVVFIDEGFWAGDKKAEGVLKSIITEPYIAIEQKGVDIIRVKNHINLLMASNNDWVVPANMQERRFFCLRVSSKRQGDHNYFGNVMHQMYRDGGLSAMLYDLIKLDISQINLSKFEHTQSLFEQKLHTMSTEMQYWFERLQDGCLISDSLWDDDSAKSDFSDYTSGADPDWHEVWAVKQHKDYLRFADEKKDRYPLSPSEFGIFLKRVCQGLRKYQKRIGNKRKWYREFPHLNDCRVEFAKQIKSEIEWDKEDDIKDETPF